MNPSFRFSGKKFKTIAVKTPEMVARRGMAAVLLAILGVVSSVPVQAEIQFRTRITPNLTIPDRGQVVSTVTIGNAGISQITGVTASVSLSSPFADDPMWLGDMFASLTHGTALEAARSVTLFDYASSDPNNSTSALSASFTTSALNGAWLPSNTWSLLAADREQGGVGLLTSWDLAIRGTAADSGTIDPGADGEISMTGSGIKSIGARANSTGTGASAVALKSDSGQTLVFSNGLSGQGFRKTGDGVVEIRGNSASYNGQLDVEAGKLVVSGTLGSGSTLVVGEGGTLGGSGTVGALQVARGGVLAVGNSPGQLNAGNTTWAGGAKYAWEVDDFDGNDMDFLAGQGTNYDFLNITGTLNVTATGGANKFIIDVISLLPTNNLEGGLAANWDASKGYSFAIATASGGIQIGGAALSSFGSQSAFDSALGGLFDIQTASFTNATGSAGLWSISTASGGQTMLLNYNGGATAIPEPSSVSLLVLGVAAVLARVRRRRI